MTTLRLLDIVAETSLRCVASVEFGVSDVLGGSLRPPSTATLTPGVAPPIFPGATRVAGSHDGIGASAKQGVVVTATRIRDEVQAG